MPRLHLRLQAAAARVMEAQRSVPRLLQERWAAAGADRSQWPLIAQVCSGLETARWLIERLAGVCCQSSLAGLTPDSCTQKGRPACSYHSVGTALPSLL